MLRLGNIAKTYVPQRDKPEDLSGPIPWLRIEDFDGKFLSGSKSGQGVSTATVAAMNLRVFPAGTVVTSCSCVMGATAIAANPLVTNQTFIGIDPDPSALDQSFLYYWLIAHQVELQARASGSIQQYLSRDEFRRLRISAPDVRSQRAIAGYLDRETAQIDAFIAKNEELITLLTERRAAVIASAVTKGLDGAAELKPSGVPALGPIPTGWTVRRVRTVGRAIIGLTYAPEDICGEGGGGTLVLRAGNIQDSQLDFEDCVYVSKSIPDSLRLRLGDIVICARNGSARLIGKNALATEEVVGQTWGAFMAVLRTPINEYLRWVLNSTIFTSSLGAFATATINQLTSSTLHSLQFALPPRDEQVAISAYLEEATNSIDEAIRAARRATELARERRAALISAAVTGNIDVGVAA